MDNRIRPYAWGSRTAIAELTGQPSPAPHPQAELWIGAHPGDPSTLLMSDGSQASLSDLIAAEPKLMLGRRVTERFGARLPFLLKVLAAAEPLSLQAHPSVAQAQQGFALEEAAGIPLNSARRNYKDLSHKPELICALTDFEALCGFREPAATVQMLSELRVPALDHYLALLSGQQDSDGIRALFSSIITIPPAVFPPILDAVLAACVERVRHGSQFSTEYRTTLELGERYPGDAGVLAAMLLNRLTLRPGQALYLPAGNLHAYLSGVAVEIMANSDNVLRGGLTPKHVDVPELMRVLDFTAGDVAVLGGTARGDGAGGVEAADGPGGVDGVFEYPAPAQEFRLARIELDDHRIDLTHDGPQVLLVVDGEAVVRDGTGGRLVLSKGRSAWIGPEDRDVVVSGHGVAFRATDGLDTGLDAA